MTIGKVRLADEFVSHQIDSIEEEQLAMSARVTTVEDEVAVVKSNALASSTTEVSNRVTTVEQDVATLVQTNLTLASATTTVSNRVTAVEQDISSLEGKDATLASATTAVSNRVTAVEQDISSLESKDVTLASATTAVGTKLAELEENIGLLGLEADTDGFTSMNVGGQEGINFVVDGISKAFVSAPGFYVRDTSGYSRHVAIELEQLHSRVDEIEAHYYDTRGTCVIRNSANQKLLYSDGNLYSDNNSTNFHYTVEKH